MLNTKPLLHFNKTLILQIDKPRIFCFQTGMAIDADGCPHAYHPDNTGLDDLKHGGHPGNWWGVATDNESFNGNPLIQNKNDPAPGYYVSTTSLINAGFSYRDPARYVNAGKIPYFVLPEHLLGLTTLGDIAWIFNTENKLNCFAIFADVGPDVGEGSIHLAKKLGIPGDPRVGGIDSGILYFVFQGSGRGNGVHLNETEIIQMGEKSMQDLDKFELTSIFR
jgi:Fungal chitosanase of glycosyl hydrolase group 75